jgi:hypothetical protein
MHARTAAIIIGGLDCLAAAVLVAVYLKSGSDPATRGFDIAAAGVTAILVAVTALPALVLSFLQRAPRTAVALALGFPVSFVLAFVAAVIVFAFN